MTEAFELLSNYVNLSDIRNNLFLPLAGVLIAYAVSQFLGDIHHHSKFEKGCLALAGVISLTIIAMFTFTTMDKNKAEDLILSALENDYSMSDVNLGSFSKSDLTQEFYGIWDKKEITGTITFTDASYSITAENNGDTYVLED